MPQVRKQCFYTDFGLFCSFTIGLLRKEAVVFAVATVQGLLMRFCPPRGEKESWIRSKYVEKKFIQKLPETGKNILLLRRSSAIKGRAATQERPAQKPPLKPKPSRATLPRGTGRAAGRGGVIMWRL